MLVVRRLVCSDEYTPSAIVLEFENELDLLKDVLFGAVKIELMFDIIPEAFDKPPKSRCKLSIFCVVPKTALFVHHLLGFIGFKAIWLSSHTMPAARAKMSEDLNRKGDEGDRQILITTYALNIAEHNFQKKCSCPVNRVLMSANRSRWSNRFAHCWRER
jgi:hypothetical protein